MIYDKLRALYEKYGNKMIYPVIYLCFLTINIIGGLGMKLPATDPNELSVIAVSDWFIGRSWEGIMVSVDYYYGFLQGLIYVPVMLLFGDPNVQYAVILVLNSVMISFVPVIAYYLSYRMRTGKIWKCLITSFVSGGFCCYYAHTKFAWSETISILLPWILIWLVFRTADCKGKVSRFFMSLLIGAVCGLSFAAHTRLIAVVLALTTAFILEKIFFGRKLINLPAYFSSLAVFTFFVIMLSYRLQRELWCSEDPALLKNTLAEFFATLPEKLANDGWERISQTFSAQMYYFVTTTWGLGAVAICLFAAVFSVCMRHKLKKEAQTYEMELAVYSFYSVLSVVFTVIFSTLYRFGSSSFYVYQDTMMFGRFIDGVVPLALVFVLIMLFTHSISVNKILGASAILLLIYVVFSLAALPTILTCQATKISPVLGLYPLRVGADSKVLLNFDSMLLTMSMTFCVMGILLVIISCTKKYRSIIISAIMTTITVYSLVFISTVYLPICRTESVEKNASVAKLSESVFDQPGAPAVTAFNISRHDALMLQFLNRNVTVKVTYDIEAVPENSFLVVKNTEDVSALENSMTPFLLIAESSTLKLFAYGERATAYMVSQNIDEEELESERNTLIPEKTTAVSETKPPETTTVPTEATTTTERTPVVSTYTVPSVVTTPADSLDSDAEWAVIE